MISLVHFKVNHEAPDVLVFGQQYVRHLAFINTSMVMTRCHGT